MTWDGDNPVGSNIVALPPLVDIFTTLYLVSGHAWFCFARQANCVVEPPASRSFNDGGHSYTSVADALRG